MSILAMKRVWATEIQPAGRKLIALKLADHCNDTGGSLFVGMAAIARDCGISRSQAQRHMHALVAAGLLSVVANAGGGARGVVPHYCLHIDRLSDPSAGGSTDATRSTAATPTADMTGGTGATGGVHATGSTDAAHGSHGCGDGVAPMRRTGSTDATQTTINHQLTITEPSKKTCARKAPVGDVDLADLRTGVDEQVWQDWVALRAKKKAPITRTALTAIVAEAAKAGLSLTEVLILCCTRGWTGFQAAWACSSDRTTAKPVSRHAGFEKIDYRKGINHDGSFQ
jgi:hypothetical protein